MKVGFRCSDRGLPRRVASLRWLAPAALLMLAACSSEDPKSMLDRAREFERSGDRASALVQYKAVLQASPGLVEARLSLGRLLLAQGDAEGAAVEFQRAAAESPSPDVAYALWAESVVRTGDFKRAVHLLASWKPSDPKVVAAVQSQLAVAWSGLGDAAKAEAALAEALKADPQFPQARLMKARLDAGKGRWTEVDAAVDALLAENAQNVDALLFKAELLEFRGDRKQAIAVADKALAADKAALPVLATLVRMRLDEREIDVASRHVDGMKAVAGWHPATVLAEAQLALSRDDFAKARERVQRLLSVLPDNETAQTLAGVIEARVGSPVQAVTHFRRALSTQPGLESVRVELARSETRLGQYADALATLQPLLALDQPPAVALAIASEAQLRLGNLKQADSLLQRAAAAAPGNSQLQTSRLVRQLQLGDAARPLAELQQLASQSEGTYADEALFAARLARGEFAAALAVLDSMAAKVPGQATHHELRGRVQLAQRNFSAARASFERALEVDAGLFGAVASLVALDLLESKPEQAIARVQKVVDRDPQHSVALIALAELKSRHGGEHEESMRLLRAAAAASPLAAEPRVRLIEQALRKRRFKEALSLAQEALAAVPGDARVLEAAGRAQLEAGDVEQAATTFRALAGAMPRSALPYMRLARVYLVQGNREAALSAVRKGLEVDPNSVEAQGNLVDLLVQMNQSGRAQEFVRRQRQMRPSEPSGYSLEAAYLVRTKAADQAVGVLREGVSRTRDPELAGKLFSLLLQLGRDAEAASFGSDWMRQHPSDAAFEYLMSVRDIARGDLRMAEQRLARVLLVFPSNGLALNNMAWVLVKNGKSGAVEYARRAVSVMPDQPDLMDTLAMALAAEGKVAEALTIQRRALDLSEGKPDIRLGLARLALQAGDKAAAREELQKLDQLGNTFREHAEVKALLQKL